MQKTKRVSAPAAPAARIDALLVKTADGVLWTLLFVAPLIMAGRHPVGRLVYVTLIFGMFLCWLLRQGLRPAVVWRSDRSQWLLLLAVGLVTLQVIPLPTWLLQHVSPHLSRLLPLWSDQAEMGPWQTVSLMPMATRGGLVMLAAYCLLFLLLQQRLRSWGDIERVLRWLVAAAAFLSVLGLAQYLLSNGKFLWVYANPFRDTHRVVRASFFNENHLAHYLALAVGPFFWWLQSALRQLAQRPDTRQRLLVGTLAVLGGVMLLAGLLTRSRGGILVLLLASGLIVLLAHRVGQLSAAMRRYSLAVMLILLVALSIHGYQSVVGELQSLTSGSIEELDQGAGRRRVWQAALQAFRWFPWLGTGVATHREVSPTFFSAVSRVEFVYAESGFVQVLLETGLAGCVLLAAWLLQCGCWCRRVLRRDLPARQAVCAAAVVTSLIVSLTHALFDFVWYIPACMVSTVILLAVVCRMAQLASGGTESKARLTAAPSGSGNRRRGRSGHLIARPAWLALLSGAMAMAGLALCDRWSPAVAALHWDRYLRESRLARQLDPMAQPGQSDYQLGLEASQAMHTHLQRVLDRNPHDARANLRMAAVCLRLFDQQQMISDNPMALAQIRDAALAAGFQDHQALARWLKAALGPNRQYLRQALDASRRALQLCPLQGEAYLYLSELDFLAGAESLPRATLVDQALRVRPFEGTVLFTAGREAALAGHFGVAQRLWARAFHREPELRQGILQLLAPHVSPEVFVQQFRPGLEDLLKLERLYASLGREDWQQATLQLYLQQFDRQLDRQPEQTTLVQHEAAYAAATALNRLDLALQYARQAVRHTPDYYPMRRRLGLQLLAAGQHGEAEEHLQWCLRRRPFDDALKGKLRMARRAAALSP